MLICDKKKSLSPNKTGNWFAATVSYGAIDLK